MPKVTPIKSLKPSKPLIYELTVTLDDARPSVWRRVQAPSTLRLNKLHELIQVAMGWKGAHLHSFNIKERSYGPDPESSDARDKSVRLGEVLNAGDEFTYVYDFGDNWKHSVKVERVFDAIDYVTYPLCVGGENACPPEDCGGPGGYEELLEKIQDPKHEEFEDAMRWLGGFFAPKSFDANRINQDYLWNWKWA